MIEYLEICILMAVFLSFSSIDGTFELMMVRGEIDLLANGESAGPPGCGHCRRSPLNLPGLLVTSLIRVRLGITG